ncbi:MAG: ATP-binding protein [Lachnospiraceae bacterium]|nr:ATP-binding protein [Lachnospiraceae bacterium]
MKISSLFIKNFKTIKELILGNIENAMIIVGKNSTGKTTILHAIRAVAGDYTVCPGDFNDAERNIEIAVDLELSNDDILMFHKTGTISKYKNFDMWYEEFKKTLPSFESVKKEVSQDYENYMRITQPEDYGGVLKFVFVVDRELNVRYYDGYNKNNISIVDIIPKVHFIDVSRDVKGIQNEIFSAQTADSLSPLKQNSCIMDPACPCINCFNCIPEILSKEPESMSIAQTFKLLEYKLMNVNLDEFMYNLNKYYTRNSGKQQNFRFVLNINPEELLSLGTAVIKSDRYGTDSVDHLSAGGKSIYILSMLEAYLDDSRTMPCIIMIEDPEIYLHPQLQKEASEILYRLSKKNQVIFSTHSPNLIFNFTSKQLKQVVLDENSYTTAIEDPDIDVILDDLGYSANDLMNVNFVFIVEGKQDSNRLPLLLKKYYSEVYDNDGRLQRISIITTNSCTNIKTYANLKYINQLYLKDQFLMIRDSDGKKPETLVKQLCSYYFARAHEDSGNIPRVQPRNVLVLKYYSFENYFLNPKVMAKIGVIKNEEDFYNILLEKFKAYLHKLSSVKRMKEITGINIKSKEDIKRNLEKIKIYVRGHNLFDIFYGKYKGENETMILQKYIDEAPRSDFEDILNSIDDFVFFSNRKVKEQEEIKPLRDKHKKKKRL